MGSFASFRQTISARLILLVTLVAAPLVGIQIYHAIDVAESARRESLDYSLQTARAVLGRIDDHVRNIDALLVTVAATVPPRRDAVDQGNATLRKIKAGLPAYFGSIPVLEADGNMLYSTESPQPRPGSVNVSERGYFKDVLASGVLGVGDPVRSRTSGKWIQVLARPIRDGAAGPIAGVVSASTVLERFQAIFAEVNLPPGSVVTVINLNGLQLKTEATELLARLGEAARYSGGGES